MSVVQLEKKDTKKDEEKPWKGICSKGCWLAKGDICKCKCGKRNHGRGVIKRLLNMENEKHEENTSQHS
jgi:hypothetical protein